MTSPDLIIFRETFPPMFWNPAVESGHHGSSHTHMDLTVIAIRRVENLRLPPPPRVKGQWRLRIPFLGEVALGAP